MKHTPHTQPARTTILRTGFTLLAALVLPGAALAGLALTPMDLLYANPAAAIMSIDSAPSARTPLPTLPALPTAQPGGLRDHRKPGEPEASATPLGEADGAVLDGVTVFDDTPAVTKLDSDLLAALRRAATDAAQDGVTVYVNSGWRSPAYQDQLLRDAIVTYGSEAEAVRWVATAETSAHVSGDAVDIGLADATAWLSKHGADYGLCQIYVNEPWHFELRPDAIEEGCPPMYPDPTHDPRMQR